MNFPRRAGFGRGASSGNYSYMTLGLALSGILFALLHFVLKMPVLGADNFIAVTTCCCFVVGLVS